MTAEEALAWVGRYRANVDRSNEKDKKERWYVSAWVVYQWEYAYGPTLPIAVTRLKAKLEAR